jgi:hypothetical protein
MKQRYQGEYNGWLMFQTARPVGSESWIVRVAYKNGQAALLDTTIVSCTDLRTLMKIRLCVAYQ